MSTVEPAGVSAFYDSCYLAAEKVNSGRYRNRALIVISDGMDNQSRYTFNELRDYLRETEVTLNIIGLSTDAAGGSLLANEGRAILDELSKLSGGFSIFGREGRSLRFDELKQAAELIAASLRHQYKIRLTPTYKSTEKWHRLKISMNVPDQSRELKGLSARAREGFYLHGPVKEEE